MSGIVILKWGGGLITHKEKICEANYDIIEQYYEDMFNKYDDYSPQEEMIYG